MHVVDSPTADIIIRENNKHFLLECPLYTNARNQMINDLNAIGDCHKSFKCTYGWLCIIVLW